MHARCGSAVPEVVEPVGIALRCVRGGGEEKRAFTEHLDAAGRPDLIVAVHWKAFRGVARLAAKLGIHSVLVLHAKEVTGRRPVHQRHRLQRALDRAGRLVCVSRFTAEQLRSRYRVDASVVHVVPPGVDTERFRPGVVDAGTRARLGVGAGPTLLTVARLVRRKGHDQVLRTLPRLVASFPRLRYVICGTGDDGYQQELAGLAAELGVTDAVHFTGLVSDDDVVSLYRASDAVVMPSRSMPRTGDTEGFGITFLEANACEKPVVAGAEGGVIDAVEHEVTGLLVDPRSIDALGEALAHLLTDPDERARMGRAGRTRVEQGFSWSAVAERYLRLAGVAG